LLTALLAAATLLAALLTTLASGRLVLLTRFLLTALLLATLLLVVRHGAILLRGGFRANIQSFAALVGSPTNKSRLAGIPEQRCRPLVSSNYRRFGRSRIAAPAK
jgi:hypothetical protein